VTGNWWFVARSEPINNPAKQFTAIRRHAGVAKCTIQGLRRSVITNWVKKLSIQVFQTRAGHSSITTTRKYYLAVHSEDFDIINEWLNNILARESDDWHQIDTNMCF
jgi:integrase